MDHAEVLDRLEAALLAPGGLAAIETDHTADGVELRLHLASCDACAMEYQAWNVAAQAMAAAAPDTLRAPAEARARVLAAVAATGARRTAAPAPMAETLQAGRRSMVPRVSWLATAAAAGAVIFLIGAFLGGPLGIAPGATAPGATAPTTPDAVPASVAIAMDEVLKEAGHREITLLSVAGAPAGTLLVDAAGDDIVVVSTALAPAPEGAQYDCYLDRNGTRTRVGRMHWDEGLSYWVGPMDEPPDAGRAGDRFIVVLDSAPATAALTGQF